MHRMLQRKALRKVHRKTRNKIVFVDENENVMFREHLVSEELNNFLKNATKSLQINENPCIMDEQSDIIDPIMKRINKYQHHPSILLINSKLSSLESFSFNKINNLDMEKQIKRPSIKKVTTFKNTTKSFKIQWTLLLRNFDKII